MKKKIVVFGYLHIKHNMTILVHETRDGIEINEDDPTLPLAINR